MGYRGNARDMFWLKKYFIETIYRSFLKFLLKF
jgi:hypothetical protein